MASKPELSEPKNAVFDPKMAFLGTENSGFEAVLAF